MKKCISILLCIMLACLCFAACSKSAEDTEEEMEEVTREAENITEVEDEVLEKAGETLTDRLSLLEKDGWKEKDGSYVYTTDEDDCKGEYTITANGNDADITVAFDYGADNSEMIDFYKSDTGAGKAICAYWYLRAVAVLDAPLGTENYKLLVDGTEVISGSMTYEEAEDIYDQYYED